MKTDKHNLEILLSDVEHAGRDERRQQELSAMIDRMAREESGERRHGVWWWVGRVAAAACLIFFISTAVRIWFIPTGESTTVVAEAEVPEVALPTEAIPAVETAPVVAQAPRVRVKPVAVQPVVVEEQEAPIVVEEYLVEEIVEEALPVEEQVEEPANNQIELIAQPVVSVAQTAEPTPEETTPAKSAKPARRSIFSTLFRPAEPSLMEGTTLALLQF